MTCLEDLATARQPAAAPNGSGRLEVSLCAGRSVVTRCHATTPLKLLSPRTRGHAAWIVQSTYGGGLLGGDDIQITGSIAPGATCFFGTQSSSKVYPRRGGQGARQTFDLSVAEGGLAVVMPDPVVCFAGAGFVQRQRFDLHSSAGLILVETVASGRRARGERWAMHRYETRIEVKVDGIERFRDAMVLDPADGPLDGFHRMGRFDCITTVVLIGKSLQAAAAALQRECETSEFRRAAPGPFALSPIAGGILLRTVGDGTESVGNWVRRVLCCVPALLGEDPWERKW